MRGAISSAPTPCFGSKNPLFLYLQDGVEGDGEPAGCFPEAAAILPSLDDLEAKVHFALLVGELAGSGERNGQQDGILPFMAVCTNLRMGGMPHFFKNSWNASRSGLEGGSRCLAHLPDGWT